MTSSILVTFSGKSPILTAHFFPEIILDAQYNHSCALVDLIIYDSIEEINKIKDLGLIRVECDIISESYINGAQSRLLYQFTPDASPVNNNNKAFVEIPKHLIFLPVKTKILSSLQISFFNHNEKLIDIADANIVCRLNIKRD